MPGVVNTSLYALHYIGQVNVLLSRVRYKQIVGRFDEVMVSYEVLETVQIHTV